MVITSRSVNSTVKSEAEQTNIQPLEEPAKFSWAPAPPVVAFTMRKKDMFENVHGKIQFLASNMFNFEENANQLSIVHLDKQTPAPQPTLARKDTRNLAWRRKSKSRSKLECEIP